MPLIGLLLGLALASKWVAAYAIGALVLLLLVRSALGRVLAILGLIAITGVLGYLAMAVRGPGLRQRAVPRDHDRPDAAGGGRRDLPPDRMDRRGDAGSARRPPAIGAVLFFGVLTLGRLDEPVVLGPVSVTPLLAAIAAALGSVAVYVAFRLGGVLGYGPLKTPPRPGDPQRFLEPPDPAPTGWLRPGWLLGLPLVWAAVCLIAIPLGVYVVSYLPWTAIENHRLWDGFPAGHSGQTLLELTGDVRLPQRADVTAPGVVALVGVPIRPEAGVVLPGELRRRHQCRHLRLGQPRDLVARHRRADLRIGHGVSPPRPRWR